MIKDCQKLLSYNGIKLEDKVFMTDYSATAKFTNKITALHPEIVKVAATGGDNDATIIPAAQWEDGLFIHLKGELYQVF